MRPSHIHLIAVLLAAGSAAAHGDVVQMPPAVLEDSATAPTAPAPVELPVRGMSMQQVETRFGAPQEKLPAVGKPPITRWVYPDYIVYFEHQYVIHSVLKRK
ncbi:hypothetical protein [Sulfurivermis fontis]|uniref:hypothetical protein n=1 Tax=Sulfurivermis fontis TaxID=1972068 RepID=UPI000FDA98E6|nr:hypothetical protein [Sulfurivermis fontis]